MDVFEAFVAEFCSLFDVKAFIYEGGAKSRPPKRLVSAIAKLNDDPTFKSKRSMARQRYSRTP